MSYSIDSDPFALLKDAFTAIKNQDHSAAKELISQIPTTFHAAGYVVFSYRHEVGAFPEF